jgi:hypothetical protein
VYLVWAERTPLFKIGYTTGAGSVRLVQLQASSPIPLVLAAERPGSRRLELDLHRKWQACRRHGEWFLIPSLAALRELFDDYCAKPSGPLAVYLGALALLRQAETVWG